MTDMPRHTPATRHTTDHGEIRAWASAHGALPAVAYAGWRGRRAEPTFALPGDGVGLTLVDWPAWFRLFDRSSQVFSYRLEAAEPVAVGDVAPTRPAREAVQEERPAVGPVRRFTRAVVTGGAGFVGSHVCEALLAQDVEVLCVDDFSTGAERNLAGLASETRFGVEEVDVRRLMTERGERIFAGADLVVHLASAASTVDSARRPVETLEAGAVGTRNVLAAAQAVGARFVLGSSSALDTDPEFAYRLRSQWAEPEGTPPQSVYVEAKRFAEAQTGTWHASRGLDGGVVRMHNLYGPRMRTDDGRMIPTFVGQARRGERLTVPGDGGRRRQVCFVDDVVTGLLDYAASARHDPVTVGGGARLSVQRVAEDVGSVLGLDTRIEHVAPSPDDVDALVPGLAVGQLVAPAVTTPWVEGLTRTVAALN
ncbi:GDP-mannose 4,6-dehydratase [Luteimicrobium xylanilyticum]|uniref:dTDP-glucose 4,6-dehydratase n=1 Tax=Luteimicrobium xylanilyticum TaxID=1133546 RepID=A0A5P9Q7M2_9MICO|nr:NAD-dependent epimerase/dehydratase family protein [Luteimicrobium xylanilyticum]QFU97421.1 dTDP-glucose 4,6-dehydratase [Luteimicrobium xylanilyticum]